MFKVTSYVCHQKGGYLLSNKSVFYKNNPGQRLFKTATHIYHIYTKTINKSASHNN